MKPKNSVNLATMAGPLQAPGPLCAKFYTNVGPIYIACAARVASKASIASVASSARLLLLSWEETRREIRFA